MWKTTVQIQNEIREALKRVSFDTIVTLEKTEIIDMVSELVERVTTLYNYGIDVLYTSNNSIVVSVGIVCYGRVSVVAEEIKGGVY